MRTPIDLFLSYAGKDEQLRNELVTQLANLERQGRIRSFDQRLIGPGQEVKVVLARRFEQARVILLLISPDFMAPTTATTSRSRGPWNGTSAARPG